MNLQEACWLINRVAEIKAHIASLERRGAPVSPILREHLRSAENILGRVPHLRQNIEGVDKVGGFNQLKLGQYPMLCRRAKVGEGQG
jgi:hypothetical protein